MANRKKTLEILNLYKETFSERFGITALGIFGSVARNEDEPVISSPFSPRAHAMRIAPAHVNVKRKRET